MAPAMNSFSKAAILWFMTPFSSSSLLFLFSRCRMYSVALLKTYFIKRLVILIFIAAFIAKRQKPSTPRLPTVALLSLWAGVRPCNSSRSSVVSSPLALLHMIRKLGTLSLKAAILSLMLVR